MAAADAAIGASKSLVLDAEAEVEAARATIERIQADIDDSVLRSPRDGRVQCRVAQLGEVLAAGGLLLNLVDLGDVYMTFFTLTAGTLLYVGAATAMGLLISSFMRSQVAALFGTAAEDKRVAALQLPATQFAGLDPASSLEGIGA